MKLLPWLFLILCLAVAAWFGQGFVHNAALGPDELLTSARTRAAADTPDHAGALRELTLALGMLQPGERIAFTEELLIERARVLRASDNPDAAAADLETALQLGLEDEVPVRLELAWVELARDELERAEAQAGAVLSIFPTHSAAHLALGLADRARLDLLRRDVLDQLHDLLPTNAANALEPDIERALLGDLDDPQRSAGTRRLELQLYREDEERAAGILLALDQGSLLASQSREHLIASLDASANPRAVQLLAEDFVHAGHPTYAVDLGLAALAHERVADSAGVLQVLAEALGDLDRPRAATAIAARAVSTEGQAVRIAPDFLPVWCTILYRGEEWQRLRAIAQEMAAVFANRPDGKLERDTANLYLGLARRELGERELAEKSLLAFANASPEEPFPGALGVSLRALADIARERGEEDFVLKYLLDATSADPEGSGAAWLDLGRIQSSRSGQGWRAMGSYAKAMQVDPRLVAEVEPLWRELGEQLLETAGRDMALERATLLRQARLVPVDRQPVFVLQRLAEEHLAARRRDGVLAVTGLIFEQLPDFPPALDLRIVALEEIGRDRDAVELRLRRVAGGGEVEEHLVALREALRRGELEGEALYRLMRLDPGNSGRQVFAQSMLERGNAATALRAFSRSGPQELAPASVLLAARAEAAAGRLQNALERLGPLFDQPAFASEALRVAILGTLESRRDPQLPKLLAQLPEDLPLDPVPALEVVDVLLSVGQPGGALQLLGRLDGHAETRSGEVLLRMAAGYLLIDSVDRSAEAIERAGAWFEDGSVEFARLLQTLQFSDWTAVPRRVQQLRASERPLSELDTAILAALEERLDEGLALSIAGEAAHPEEPLWVLVRLAVQSLRAEPLAVPAELGPEGRADAALALSGNARAPRDPRRLLAALLALEDPVWRSWAAGTLDGLRPADTWSTWIAARIELEGEQFEAASRRLAELLESRPGFLPGWWLQERALLGLYGRRDHPELLKVRAQAAQVRSGGRAEDLDAAGQADRMAVQAQARLQQGDLERATALLRAALVLDPENRGLLQLTTTVLAGRGDWSGACTSFLRLLQIVDAEERFEALPQLVQLIERGVELDGLQFVEARHLLETAEELCPADPELPAAAARLDLIESAQSPRLASVRAFARLDAFRERTHHASLEVLREGATATWVQLIGRLDPIEAERLVQAELEADPTRFGLWRTLGAVLTDQERQPEALELYDTVLAMGPDPAVLLAAAELLAEAGNDRPRVEAMLTELAQSGTRPANDPAAELISAKGRLNAGPQSFGAGLQMLERLWLARENLPPVFVPRLAGTYGTALVRGAQIADRALARSVLEQRLESPTEPLENALFRSLLELADVIPAAPASP